MEGDFPLSRYIHEGLSDFPPSLFPNYISAFQSEINGGEGSSSLQLYGGGVDYNNNYGSSYSLFGSHPNPIIGSYNEFDLMEFQRNLLQQQSSFINGDYYYNNQNLMRSSLMVSGSGFDQNVVKMEQHQQQIIPKSEILESTPLNMIDEGFSIPNLNSSDGVYHDDGFFSVSEPALKRFRSSSSSSSSSSSMVNTTTTTTTIPFLSLSSLLRSSTQSEIPSSILAREKRKIVSDRIKSLEKLMPWDKKMNMATLLEEAYKYIKFLQAQVSVLQSMPCQSSFITTGTSTSSSSSAFHQSNNGGGGGGLEKLNRQQLLKVLLNSQVAQTNLYAKGWCVYSLEQLILLKKIAGHRILLQQIKARSSSSSSSSSSSAMD